MTFNNHWKMISKDYNFAIDFVLLAVLNMGLKFS